MAGSTIYECSDGAYYGDADLWERLESGTWTSCCWDEDSGAEWVETANNELLALNPISKHDLPDWVQVKPVTAGVSVTIDPQLLVETVEPITVRIGSKDEVNS